MQLSIITINLNNSEGLRKTIESVVSQTFTDFEYIIIDGGSTDGSVDTIKQYSDKIAYWISEPDKGIYNAMNKGIVQAKGKYCLFLNSGDWLAEKNILSSVFKLNLFQDIIYGNLIISKHGKDKQYLTYPQEKNISLFFFYSRTFPHQSTFIRKTLFDKRLFAEEYKIVSDVDFFINAIIYDKVSIKYINMVVSYMEDGGVGTVINELHLNERKILKEKYFKYLTTDFDHFLFLNSSPLMNEFVRLRKTTGFEKFIAKLVAFLINIYSIFRKI